MSAPCALSGWIPENTPTLSDADSLAYFLLFDVSLPQLMCRKDPSLEDFSWSEILDTEVQSRLQQVARPHVHMHTCTHVHAE